MHEVDSMGGFIDGGVENGIKTSPSQAAIENIQAEFRQQYDSREETRRLIEYLEKGGDALDFKHWYASSISVQSTSLSDRHPEHFVTSKENSSYVLNASPHGNSVGSSGRPGVLAICEPNSADNLVLFDAENGLLKGRQNPIGTSKMIEASQSEWSSKKDGSQSAKKVEDSAIFRPYARRNRSRSNRDVVRSRSADRVQSRSGHESSLPNRSGTRETKRLVAEVNDKNHQNALISNPKGASSNGDVVSEIAISDGCELDVARSHDNTGLTKGNLHEVRLDVTDVKNMHNISCTKCPSYEASEKLANGSGTDKRNRFSDVIIDMKIPTEFQNSHVAFGTKGSDSESSCTQTSLSLDVNNENNISVNPGKVDSLETPTEQTSKRECTLNLDGNEMVQEKDETRGVANGGIITGHNLANKLLASSSYIVKAREEIYTSSSSWQNKGNNSSHTKGFEQNDQVISEIGKKDSILLGDNSIPEKETTILSIHRGSLGLSASVVPENNRVVGYSTHVPDLETCFDNHLKLANKAREDLVLEEAQMIEARRRRSAKLYVGALPLVNRLKSQWDFVLEEMVWLANDFAQERLWKMSAAAQVCHAVTSTSRLRLGEQNKCARQKKRAYTLAQSVMHFWVSAEVLLNGSQENSKYDFVGSSIVDGNKVFENKMMSKELDEGKPRRTSALQGYAVKFLKHNKSSVLPLQGDESMTPDSTSELGIVETPWEDHLTEESLFYIVPPGAMEIYRKSIKSYLVQSEKAHNISAEEVEASIYGGSDFGYEALYDEDEGETSTYHLSGASEGCKSPKFTQKKRKQLTKSCTSSPYYVGNDYGHSTIGAPQPFSLGKRPPNDLSLGSIPTKRIRTASRQRVLSSAGGSGGLQAPAKTVSSGDANSFQDDQSTSLGGSQFQRGVDVESFREFEQDFPYDYAETSKKPKKKKKTSHLGSQIDSTGNNKQKNHSKKRLESHHFESNRTVGISQVSNMSNPSKFIRLIARDRGKSSEVLKISAGQHSFGSPWSTFEDQALVVLVHDMGRNWELVSDAINSTMKLKCIFRKPKECKERHKILMDNGEGHGADSAEDSGSSQTYPSTLPGIPKGSATQLFQHLQRPMEEDNLKSHFGKIISIRQRHHYRRNQNDTQDLEGTTQIHNSHVIALSQVCPNNLNGGVLMPLDLCDTNTSSKDIISLDHRGSHPSGVAISNQGDVSSTLPTTAAFTQVSSGMMHENNLPSPSGLTDDSVRDGKYSVPRAPSSLADEQQKMQQYYQILQGRQIQHPSLSVPRPPSGTDRGVHMLPSGNGSIRSMQIPRPRYQGMPSSMLNSGNIHTSGVRGMPSPVNMLPGAVPCHGQGNSILRPREALHVMRPGINTQRQKQIIVPELQMQATQGNAQGVPGSNGLTTGFCNQTYSTAVQKYPGHSQQQHQMSPQNSHGLSNSSDLGAKHNVGSQQQAFAIRVAKERHMRQRYLQQQQQFATSNALMPHAQSETQLPVTSSFPKNSQIQSQSHQHHLQPQSPCWNPQTVPSALINQMGKQRHMQPQKPQFKHLGMHLPLHQHHSQSKQAEKLTNGAGKGSMLVQQNLSNDAPQLNEHVAPERVTQSHLQQKRFSGMVPPSSMLQRKQLQQASSHSDNSTQEPQSLQKQVNQIQPTTQKTHPQNQQLNSVSQCKFQSDKVLVDQQSINIVSHRGTTVTVSPTCDDSANVVPAVSSPLGSYRNASEEVYDSTISNFPSQVGSVASPPYTKSVECTPMNHANGGLDRRQLPGRLPPHSCDVAEQEQQHLHKPREQPLPQQQMPPQQQS